TKFEHTWEVTPAHCVRILAMARFICPDREIRIACGREMRLRWLQPIALHVANSLLLSDYLTSDGLSYASDLAMIRDNGCDVLGSHKDTTEQASPRQPPSARTRATRPPR